MIVYVIQANNLKFAFTIPLRSKKFWLVFAFSFSFPKPYERIKTSEYGRIRRLKECREAWSATGFFLCALRARYSYERRGKIPCSGERMLLPMSATMILLFGLLVAIVALATIAARLPIPYAALLVLGGLLLGFIPGLPRITLDPNLVLFLFLPPLIYSSAWLTSWREFRTNLRPILQLSIGLVLATTIIVAAVAHVIAGLSWPVA